MKLNTHDCGYMQLPREVIFNNRYLAAPYPGLGVCVYTIGDSELWHCQLFPATDSELHTSYVIYVSKLASGVEGEGLLRGLYKFFMAPDLLTLKAQITEAAEQWKEYRQHEHL